jgi:hypothetical protein
VHSRRAFAHLCGGAPIPASNGQTHRHRPKRGRDRRANNALYIVVIRRLRYDSPTRAYATGRTTEGLVPEVIRCSKHYVAREIFIVLTAPQGQRTIPQSHRDVNGGLTRATGAARCIYALGPADRPGREFTADRPWRSQTQG